jgi:hypothetical protein
MTAGTAGTAQRVRLIMALLQYGIRPADCEMEAGVVATNLGRKCGANRAQHP